MKQEHVGKYWLLCARSLALISIMTGFATAMSSEEDKVNYPFMAQAMEEVGGDFHWKSYKAITEDNYILTLFRIVGDADGERIDGQGSKGPLLLQHGFLTDSITWLINLTDDKELAVGSQLFLEGYDVWFGNIRGSRNSREHVYLDPNENESCYWDFSFTEFGRYDLPAMLATIKENADEENACKKITYVGHSQGSIMAFSGLSEVRKPDKYLAQFVALAPCFIGNTNSYMSIDEGLYRGLELGLNLLDIKSLFGPEWPKDVDNLCCILGEESETCAMLRGLPLGPLLGGTPDGYQEVGVKQSLHMVQNYIENRFQEYA